MSSMADPVDLEWSRFTKEAQRALEWAAAVEVGGTVGTRGLLIGIIRQGGPDGDAVRLLQHYGIDIVALHDALAAVRTDVRVDISPTREFPLTSLPRLTGNATTALLRASAFGQDLAGDVDVGPAQILAGILRIPDATACQALRVVLKSVTPPVRLEDIAAAYEAYLADGGRSSIQAFLRLRESPGTGGPSSAWSPSVERVVRAAEGLINGLGTVEAGAGRAAVLLCALQWATTNETRTVADGLLGALPGDVAERGSRLAAAQDALHMTTSDRSGDRDQAVAVVVADADGLRRSTGDEAVHLRHLLAAAVASTAPAVPDGVLDKLGVRLPGLRARLRAAIAEALPDSPPDAWDRILLEPTETFDLLGGYSPDIVDPNDGIDRSQDHLGVGTYVAMLAALIADRKTPEPLSIGLFGAWGSGKSYFMGLLRGEIERLAGRGGPYYGHIRQIGFNAWHYSDTNIWASLGAEIFEELAGTDPESDEERIKDLRERLRTQLSSQTYRRRELEIATTTAKEETARLSRELEAQRATRTNSLIELARAVSHSSTVQGQVKTAWSRLGISDEVSQGVMLRDEIGGLGADVDELRLLWRGKNGTWLLLAAAVVVLVFAVWSVMAPTLAEPIERVGAAFSTVAAAALLLVGRIRSGAGILASASKEISDNLIDQRDTPGEGQPNAKVKELLDALRTAEATQRVLETQRQQVVNQIGELGRELAQLDPGQRMYRFVTERAGADDYRRNLGLISTVRKDFEQLVLLLRDWRENRGDPPKGFVPIDRIVLYIDDLDRCSPRQVVEVLQAVHLLLALDLFVVVVGVDPRWLLRSLKSEFERVLTVTPEPSGEPWQVAPEDYLEKIFNIPFCLPHMNAGSFERVLKGFLPSTDETADPPAARQPVIDHGTDKGGHSGSSPEQETGLPPSAIPAEGGSEVKAVETGATTAALRPITDPELRLLAALAPLVETPREAKRLVNLYRLIRSTRDLRPASRFLGDDDHPGDYEAVVILLGLMSGHGRLLKTIFTAPAAGDIRGGLMPRASTTTWRSFVRDMEPREIERQWRNDVVGAIPLDDLAAWQRMHAGLTGVTNIVNERDLETFKFWAPRVARFSFMSTDMDDLDQPL